VVELSLHGSPVVLDAVVRLICRMGARPASRGEYTRRAFLSGKLDLVQAEAVIDLIESASLSAAEDARARLDKGLSAEIRLISGAVKDLIAELEAFLDHDEDDEMPPPQPEPALHEILARMEKLRTAGESGRLCREGINTVITGKPNVGKSSLFNALLGTDRVIVTPYPGTTRDPVDAQLLISGNRFVVWDTAGVRSDPQPIEEEGIRRSLNRIQDADLVIAVIDGSSPLDEEDYRIIEECLGKTTVIVLNKMDLGLVVDPSDQRLGPANVPRLPTSAKTGQGTADLAVLLGRLGADLSQEGKSSGGSLTRRGLLLLEAAERSVREIVELLRQAGGIGPEIVSLELRRSLEPLEEITGERVEDGILERIFERFCVGK